MIDRTAEGYTNKNDERDNYVTKCTEDKRIWEGKAVTTER